MRFFIVYSLLHFFFEANCYYHKAKNVNSKQIFHLALDGNGSLSVDWTPDYNQEIIWFEIHVPLEVGWFAFGFSDRGERYPADYCVLWRDWRNSFHLQDVWADNFGVLRVDKNQDCSKFQMKKFEKVIKYIFKRKFDTCDEHDYIIEDGTTHLVWAKGSEALYQLDGLNISTNSSGMSRTQLLKTLVDSNLEDENTQKLDILVTDVKIPDEETMYWCHVHKLDDKFREKHHILQYEPLIENKNEGLVHHMEVFHCVAPVGESIPSYAGSCFASDRPESTQVCKRVLAAWAMGAKAFAYPKEAALPIGGPNFNPYIMLEVHYNNPQKLSGFVDNSGIRFLVTRKLRRFDAGVIELGLEYTDKMAIPQGQASFSLSGYCVSECTAVGLPFDGITVFGSQLHTHLTGIRVVTRHFRDGTELYELNRDNHYSTHFQEIRRLPGFVKVLPGDALITTCDYNTVERTNITLGGFSISDEMCVNYIHYFPATKLEVCKSAISDDALATFFRYMRDWENQEINTGKATSENYKSITWNRMRVQLLSEVYKEAPLSMQCNMSTGNRFPGYWENTPITSVLRPLPPPARNCFND